MEETNPLDKKSSEENLNYVPRFLRGTLTKDRNMKALKRVKTEHKFPNLHEVDCRMAVLDLDYNESASYDHIHRATYGKSFYVIRLFRDGKFVTLLKR